jgi:hypothetical protein
MKVRVQEIHPTPSGLVMGVQIRGPKDSWVRFAQVEVPWASVGLPVIEAWQRWYDAEMAREQEDLDVPLDLVWGVG